MNLHELELLAPAGKMDVLHSVIEAGADAVYLGGKRFNMRELRPEYNFSDDELKQAVEFVHGHRRRIYITVNNLYYSHEIGDITGYLFFLQDLGVDALIVQDLGIATLCQQLELNIPLHASVQMGIANLEAMKLLEEKGFTRAILSKNVSLVETAAIAGGTGLGIEYFVHGDLCVAHTGQCYMSSIMTGEHGNRGRCRKPCRWLYQMQGGESGSAPYKYYLAHKDLCLYPYLKQLAEAGVTSFKIEGRMRSAPYLGWLVSAYRQGLDRLIAAPDDYTTDQKELEALHENRIRNYTAGSLLKPLDWTAIDLEGEREPVKSQAEVLPRLDVEGWMETVTPAMQASPELTVKVGGLDGLEAILPLGIDNIILGSEIIWQNKQNWTAAAVLQAARMAKESPSRLFLETPRIVSQNDLPAIADLRDLAVQAGIDGVIVNDIGSLRMLRGAGFSVRAGYGLNIFNHAAAQFLLSQGIERITASLELSRPYLLFLLQTGTPAEIVVHGPLPCMVSDYCMVRAAAQAESDDECPCYCLQGEHFLRDMEGQQYRIVSDAHCRTYLYAPYDLCLLPYLHELALTGAKSFRIEGQFYQPRQVRDIVAIYHETLRRLAEGEAQPPGLGARLASINPNGLTAAAYLHDPS
ncbi:MAG: U32 family peptidase [Syntrophomonadaceae bacterium]